VENFRRLDLCRMAKIGELPPTARAGCAPLPPGRVPDNCPNFGRTEDGARFLPIAVVSLSPIHQQLRRIISSTGIGS